MSSKKWWTEEFRAYILLVLPAVLLYWAVTAFPFIFSVCLSLTNYSGGKLFSPDNPIRFVGFTHYAFMFSDPYFWIALKNNFLIIFISIFGQIPLGFIIAYILHRKLVRFTSFFQSLIYFPAILPPIVIGILWQSFFNPYGPFTEIVQKFIPTWENTIFLDFKTAMFPVLFVILWMYTGNYLIIFLANLQKIEPEIIEAAKIDGASEGQVMRYVILPVLSGVIVVSAILAITGSLNSFSLIWAMTQGNPARMTSVLSIYMYHTAFTGAPNYPLANAISTFIVCTSFLLILITKALEKQFGGEK
ncbi:MAG: sugar ABC transporter permease [Firmicutes bacterium]|nr:sugar ABC transporter permease [Bacillota bacterium]